MPDQIAVPHIHSLADLRGACALCSVVEPISQFLPHPRHVMGSVSYQSMRRSKITHNQAIWVCQCKSLTYIKAPRLFLSFPPCHAAFIVVPLLHKATFKSSHYPPNLTSVYPLPVFTNVSHRQPNIHHVHIHSLHVYKLLKQSVIHFACQSLLIPAHSCTASFLALSIRVTPIKLLRQFLLWNRTNLSLSHTTFRFPIQSRGKNYTLVQIHFLAFIIKPLRLSTVFRAPHALQPSFILCTKSLSQPPSVALATTSIIIIIYHDQYNNNNIPNIIIIIIYQSHQDTPLSPYT